MYLRIRDTLVSEFCRNHEKYGNWMTELQEEMISAGLGIGMLRAVYKVMEFISEEYTRGY